MHLNANPHASNHVKEEKRVCSTEDKAGRIIASMSRVSVEGFTTKNPFGMPVETQLH